MQTATDVDQLLKFYSVILISSSHFWQSEFVDAAMLRYAVPSPVFLSWVKNQIFWTVKTMTVTNPLESHAVRNVVWLSQRSYSSGVLRCFFLLESPKDS